MGGDSAVGWASRQPGGGEGGQVPAVRVGGSPSRRAGWCVPSSQEFAAGGDRGEGSGGGGGGRAAPASASAVASATESRQPRALGRVAAGGDGAGAGG